MIDINRVVELRLGSIDYFGPGAIHRTGEILYEYRKKGIKRVAVITGGSSYIKSGAWEPVKNYLLEADMEYALYDGIQSNPTVDQIDQAVERVKGLEPELIIGIGGGSPLDAAKAVAILLKHRQYNARALYRREFIPVTALPVVTINLTHGTGSEVDRYAVATIPEDKNKSGIGYNCIYPEFAIDDPELTLTLPADQTIYTTLDAMNHAIEAATTTKTSPFTIMIAKEAIRLICQWLPRVVKNPSDTEARYWLLYASVLGGTAIDSSVVHITHPMEHVLSAFKPEIAHGLGLSVLLPAVLRTIYPYTCSILSEILTPIIPGLKGSASEADTVAKAVKTWLCSFDIPGSLAALGFTEKDIDHLVQHLLRIQRQGGSLSLSPVPVTDELLREIYLQAMYDI